MPGHRSRSPLPHVPHAPPPPVSHITPWPPPTHPQRTQRPYRASFHLHAHAASCPALTAPARRVPALSQPPDSPPRVRRTHGGYGKVEVRRRRLVPPTAWGPGMPCELAEAVAAGGRAEKNGRRRRTFFGGSLLHQLARDGSSTLDSCR